MKKKPMLIDKVLRKRQNQKKDIIGLIGAHHGAGVTHTGLMIAFYMGEELGKRTAFLECNDHHDLCLIQPAYEWSREGAYLFSFGNITCFKDVLPQRVPEIISDEFECCILDFGTNFQKNREEFLRCTTKIVLGGQVEWNRLKLVQFIKDLHSIRGSDSWINLIPYADQRVIKGMKNELNRIFYPVPFEADPTLLSRETIRLFDNLFH